MGAQRIVLRKHSLASAMTGPRSLEYQDKVFRNLKCRRIQCDEIWSFVYTKEKKLLCGAKNKRRWRRVDMGLRLTVYSPYECVFKEIGESGARGCALLHALQFLPDSSNLTRDSDVSGRDRSCLESGRNYCTTGLGDLASSGGLRRNFRYCRSLFLRWSRWCIWLHRSPNTL